MSDAPGFSAEADRATVARVLAGDREAFAELVDRHQGRVRAHAARLVGASAADDLAQDAFVRAFTGLARYDPAYPFRGWLLVIVGRLAANHAARRRERPMPVDADGRTWEPAGGDDPAQASIEADDAAHLRRRLDAAVASLPGDSRELYELRFRQQLTVDELAAHFAISEAAVKVRVHRLRATLAERLGLKGAA